MKTVLGAIGFDPEAPVIQEIKLKFPRISFIFPNISELNQKARADILLINETSSRRRFQ